MAITRAALRRLVGEALGDMTPLIATATGTTTQFTDTIRISGGIESPKNRDIVFTSGTNLGTVRRVSTHDTSAGYVTFAAVALATAVADTAEMYNFRSKGWKVEEYNAAINRSIQSAYPTYKQPYNGTVALTFDETTGNIVLPATITHVEELEYQDGSGFWQTIPQSRRRGRGGWYVDDYSGTINMRDTMYTTPMNGMSLRLIGFTRPLALATDAATTPIHQEWLVLKTASILCLSALDRDAQNYNRGMIFKQDADKNEAWIRTRHSGNARSVTYA